MLLVRSGNSVLLQKRPDKAIWGGLWSLPETAWSPKKIGAKSGDIDLKYLFTVALPHEKLATLMKSCKAVQKTTEIKHVFTHRRLWMHIWLTNASKEWALSSPDLRWVPLNQLGRYGLPQPIKILLQGLSLVRGDDLKS